MAVYDDLSPYTYWTAEEGVEVADLNVGWLGAGEFPTGPVDPAFLAGLNVLADLPVNATRGTHDCPFCAQAWGNAEIHVLGPDRTIYGAPSLITHYVDAHGYLPPQPFVDAVLIRVRAFWDTIERFDPPAAQDAQFRMSLRWFMGKALTWSLWDAAEVINGGPVSKETFRDFRHWLVWQGSSTFTAAVCRPDTLAAIPQIRNGLPLMDPICSITPLAPTEPEFYRVKGIARTQRFPNLTALREAPEGS